MVNVASVPDVKQPLSKTLRVIACVDLHVLTEMNDFNIIPQS